MRMPQSATPKVSVIIPTYNRAALLPRAVNSVLAQTFQDYEIIIVEDCSPDNTQDVIAAFSDPRIRLIRHSTRNQPQTVRRYQHRNRQCQGRVHRLPRR